MSLLFAVGTGRCGSLALTNLLNCSPTTLALHEGQHRAPLSLEPIKAYLPLLTLENLAAYLQPETATALIRERRFEQLAQLFEATGKTHIAEVAYYLSPFTRALYEVFPDSKIIFLVRNGADFVRSVYTVENPDPTPVGYIDRETLSPVERFIQAGRLKMADADNPDSPWQTYSAFQKNAWLWAETNRVILDGLTAWPEERVLRLNLEDWVGDLGQVRTLLAFAGITDCDESRLRETVQARINTRAETFLPPKEQWGDDLGVPFDEIAGPMMQKLGYTR